MSKKRAIMGSMILVLITGLVTFTLTNVFALSVGDKVLVSKQNYEYTKKMNETYSKMLHLKRVIEENYYQPVDESKFEDGVIKGLFEALDDPYSVYMNKKEFTSFMEHTEGGYGGIGVVMSPGKDGLITVVAPFEDTPGDRAGMKTGDKILKVNGKEVTADKLDEAVAMIKGKPGTKVTLTIMRENRKEPFAIELTTKEILKILKEKGEEMTEDQLDETLGIKKEKSDKMVTVSIMRESKEEIFDIELTREEIRIKTVKSKMLEDGLGYIRIAMFDEKTADDFMNHLKKLEKQNIKGLVIDLRDNPGGLLTECVSIADRLLGKQTIVYTQNRAGERDYKKSDKNKVDYPFVLLVNGGSASASEILSGAVKDTNSGTLIGTTTFGKGLVQQVINLKDGTGFKLTTSQYFTPNGTYIHGKGIEPNIVIEMPEELKEKIDITDKEDVQLQKGIEVLKGKIVK